MGAENLRKEIASVALAAAKAFGQDRGGSYNGPLTPVYLKVRALLEQELKDRNVPRVRFRDFPVSIKKGS